MADCKRQMNSLLGIKRQGTSVLAVSDLIMDVLQFLPRKELDTLQIVSVRFNAIIEEKLRLVCLRQLRSAQILRSSVQRQSMLIMDEVGSKKMTRLPTGVDDETAANTLLVNACKSSRLENLELYGTTPMQRSRFALRPSSSRTSAWVLIRTCFKAGVTLRSHRNDDGGFAVGDTALVENALMEFCFGACDEKYAMRGRYLHLNFRTTPKKDFLQRWIEKAEVLDCRHKLTLEISSWQVPLRQDTSGLGVYKRSQTEWTTRFESANGRHWTAECTNYGDSKHLSLEINQ